jgi:hypothetical protein
MASESTGMDFGDKVFKCCANISNVAVILVCPLEDQSVTSILKMITFIHILKF